MSRTKTTLAALLLPLAISAQTGTLRVSGHIDELGNDTLIAAAYDREGHSGQAKVAGNNGDFDLTVAVAKPMNLMLQVKKPRTPGERIRPLYLRSLAVPGEHLQIDGPIADCKVAGSKFYTEYARTMEIEKQYAKAMNDARMQLSAKIKDGGNRDSLMEAYNQTMSDINDRQSEAMVAYIKANPASESSAAALTFVKPGQTASAAALLAEEVRDGRFKDMVDAATTRAQKTLDREKARKSIVEGNAAPDFTLKNLDGGDLSLSSLRGKYVVLDFWGSWCGWCIKGFPKMKEYYDKYKDKLEILGIDCNDTDAKWRDAVKKYSLPWKHVRNEGKPDVSVMYGVSGYPTKIIISPDGKISKIVVGESEDFYTAIDQLLK